MRVPPSVELETGPARSAIRLLLPNSRCSRSIGTSELSSFRSMSGTLYSALASRVKPMLRYNQCKVAAGLLARGGSRRSGSFEIMSIDRRRLLACGAGLAGGTFLNIDPFGQTKPVVNLQLGWIASGDHGGEICAKAEGLYAEEGIVRTIQPGGPNIDGVAVVASGRYEAGQVSSSPSLMLAASQDLPVVCFGVGAQEHPYTFFSLPKRPVRTPADLAGKKVGIQPTGVILLKALLAKNNIPEKDVEIVAIGPDMAPLLTG